MHPDGLIDDIAAATAECGMQHLANWFPAERHEALRELLFDLTVGALAAFRDTSLRCVPEPTEN
jgi:hypothetical protein